jgi:hypothetical protein
MLLCFTTSADSRRDRRHMTEHQARLARLAYTDFGKGSGHPAGLNFGDCLSYALATDLRERYPGRGAGQRARDSFNIIAWTLDTERRSVVSEVNWAVSRPRPSAPDGAASPPAPSGALGLTGQSGCGANELSSTGLWHVRIWSGESGEPLSRY